MTLMTFFCETVESLSEAKISLKELQILFENELTDKITQKSTFIGNQSLSSLLFAQK